MKKVLLTEEIRSVGIAALEQEVEVVIAPDPRPETIISMVADFDGIISRNTFIGYDIFANAPKLKVVASHGVGTDHIDIEAANKFGVYVVNTPGANAESVAEVVVGLMLCLSRRLVAGDYAMRINKDYYARNKLIGRDLYKKVIGIIGMGQIGRKLARICKEGFLMEILGFDPYVTEDEMKSLGVKKISDIDEVLRKADFVSLNCPYNDELHHMIDDGKLKLMKPSSYIINCARGQLIDEKALYNALYQGTIAGAAIDVYSKEPPDPDNPLFKLPNIIATPHIAANAEDSINNMSLISALDVLYILRGETDKAHIVNRELLEKNKTLSKVV